MKRDKTQNNQSQTDDQRAVSPVIGVILMVAITVILAAVIAAFVMDIGPGNSTITAAADISEDPDNSDQILVKITSGGDELDGIAAVNQNNGQVDKKSESNVNTGAEVTLDVGGSGDYTVYGYSGSVTTGTDSSIDEADANVELGSIEFS